MVTVCFMVMTQNCALPNKTPPSPKKINHTPPCAHPSKLPTNENLHFCKFGSHHQYCLFLLAEHNPLDDSQHHHPFFTHDLTLPASDPPL